MMLLWMLSSRTCGFNSKFKFWAICMDGVTIGKAHKATRGQGAIVITVTKGNDNTYSVI